MISFTDFQNLDIRIGEIKAVNNHPNADKLYLLDVDFGDHQRRLVAGLKQYYTPEEMTGKKIAVLINLEPAVIRGETSEGMLLAAQGGEVVSLLTLDRDLPNGSKVR